MQSMTDKLRGPASPLAILGAALYWAWVDTLLFTPTLLRPFDQPGHLFIVASATAILVDCAILATAAYRPSRAERLLSSGRGILALGFSGVLGGLLVTAGGYVDSTGLVVVGGLANGIAFGGGILLWGRVCAFEGASSAGVHVPAAFSGGVLIDLLVSGMVSPMANAVIVALPLASFMICAQVERGLNRPAGEDCVAPSEQVAPRATWFGLRVNVIVSFALFGFAFGFMEHSNVLSVGSTSDAHLYLLVRGLVSLTLFLGFAFARWKPHVAFRVGMVAMIAGFAVMPFAFGVEGLGGVSGCIIMAGYTCFDVMAWMMIAELSHESRGASLGVIGVGRCLVHLGVATGMSVGAVASFLPMEGQTGSVLITSVGYLLVIALILLIDDSHGLWFIMKHGSLAAEAGAKPSGRDKAEVASARYGLTSREREVLELLVSGRSARYIGEALYISESTVNSHVHHIYGKMGVHGKQELIDLVESLLYPQGEK